MKDELNSANILIVQNGNTRTVSLDKDNYSFGRAEDGTTDIVCDAPIVSREHGLFFWSDGEWFYKDVGSSNGTFINERHFYGDNTPQKLQDGTILRVDDVRAMGKRHDEGIMMYFFYGDMYERYMSYNLDVADGTIIEVGRDPSCQIHLDTVTVSRRQGYITKEMGRLYYQDHSSTNGSYLNGVGLRGRTEIHGQDVLVLGNIKMLFIGNSVVYSRPNAGSFISIRGLTKVVNDAEKRGRKKTILNDVNADIAEGRLVAILGTSGAGKTTFMNCMIGYEAPTHGQVLVNGTDLYANKKDLKRKIGYVPQEDLLRDGLGLAKTLDYIGKLRLSKDVSKAERRNKIYQIMDELDLERKLANSHIKKLSGGQRKRVSIASELLSDPPMLFLDEPTSGLDPETETKLVALLKKLAHEKGKTLMVVTHTIRNIHEFDQVLFFGPGGKLCFSGSPRAAEMAFDVEEFIDIYPLVARNPDYYAARVKKKVSREN